MRRLSLIPILLSLCLGGLPAAAADFDGTKPVLCSLYAVTECPQDGPCASVTPESVSLPPFVKIDLAAKTVMPAKAAEVERRSEIRSLERIGGRVILQGADAGPADQKRALGWTASLSEETGKLVLSVAGDDVAFVIFGACLAL